jgi:hypothetical protein
MNESEEETTVKRRHIRHYKDEKTMYAECEEFVKQRKRLPILHSRWLLNRYTNAGYSLHGLEVANKDLHNRLEIAEKHINELRQQLAERPEYDQ